MSFLNRQITQEGKVFFPAQKLLVYLMTMIRFLSGLNSDTALKVFQERVLSE